MTAKRADADEPVEETGSFGDAAGEAPDQGEPVEPPVGEAPAEESEATAESSGEATAGEAGSAPTVPLEDLQRLQAEYANYRKRVDRDRTLVAENATYQALVPIVEVLDTIDRAREHSEVSGQPLDEGLKAVADQLERAVTGRGLTRFGEPGEVFDPSLHEALSHLGEDADVEVTTVKQVVKAGYRIGDRVVRAAQVLVVDPA